MKSEHAENQFDLRLAAIEIRLSSVEAQLNNIIGAVSDKKRKSSKTNKERVKAELVMNGPYDKMQLEEMKGTNLKLLASTFKINSFGIKKDELVKAVLAAQKTKAGKNGIQAATGK
jgi:hypothetical protein